MKANNSKYTMFAKRVATMVVAMFMVGIGNAWGADETLSLTGSWWTDDSYETSTGSKETSAGNAIGLAWTETYQNSTYIQMKKKEGEVHSTTYPSTNMFIKSITVTVQTNTANLYGSTDLTTWTSITFTSGSAVDVESYRYKYFKVTSTSNYCQISAISVTYTAPTPHTITFNAQGGICGTSTSGSVESYTLPAASPSAACISEGWGFYGWATARVASETTTAPTIVGKAGDTYYPASDITLHAVYTKGEYTKVNSITSGEKYLIVSEYNSHNYIMTTDVLLDPEDGYYYLDAALIDETSSNKYHAAAVNAAWLCTFISTEGGYFIQNSSGGYIDTYYDVDWFNHTPLDEYDIYTITFTDYSCTINNSYGTYSALVLFDNETFGQNGTTYPLMLYRATTTPTYYSNPSCCDKIVELSKGTETNATISSMTPAELPTCSATDADRNVTIVAAAATGYKFDNGAELSYSGDGTATLVSATNGTAPYTWVYRLSQNATGSGTFSVSSATPKAYTITLNGNGATTAGSANVTATYNSNDLSAAITNPKKTDYIFDGWFSGEGGSGSLIIDKAGALQANVVNYTGAEGIWTRDEATTLYAKWSEHSYINYRTNCCTEYEVELANSGVATGGTFEASKTSVCEGKEVTLTATPGTGYEFDAWTVYKKGDTETPVSVSNNKFEMPAYDVTVEAAFALIEYDITYHLGGGTNHANNPASYYYTSDEITLEDPSYAGYAFLGWYDNSSFEGDAVTTIPNHSTGNIELWANWIADTQRSVEIIPPSNGTITVSWNNGVSSFSTGSQNIEIGTELTIEAAGATGYDAGTITVNGTPLVGSTYTLDEDALTIVASFSLHNYSITYNLDGGEGATNTTYTYESEAITLPTAPTVHKTGYTFMGWFDNSGFEGDAVTTIPNHSTGDKPFWAKWSKNSYTLTWNLAGGTVTEAGTAAEVDATGSPSADVPYGDPVSAPTVTKTGYTFNGWNATPVTLMPAEAKTYTATWTKNNYHVYFQNNGVTINEYTKEVAYEAQIGTLPGSQYVTGPCDESDKIFKGWSTTKIEGTQKDAPDYAESTDVMGAEDLYLYAVFAAEVEGPTSSPISVFTQSGIGEPTSGYELTLGGGAEKPKSASYYQDGGGDAGTKRWVQIEKKNTSSAMITTTPKTVTVTATLGGGTAKTLGNSVCAVWLDASGNELGDPVVLTNSITVAGGSDFSANLPLVNATSAYGVRVYHSKESNYNVRYFGISLSYTVSSTTYSDYMTHCCSLVAVEDLAAVDNTSDTEVTLNWKALSSANQEGVTKLQVVDADNNVIVDDLAASATSATVTELTQCDTYSFRVATVGASCTTYSEAVDARPFGSAKTVSFNYNYDGGAGSATSETTTCDESSVTLATPDGRSGYRFMGWYNGDDKVGDANASYTPSASIELQAHWAQEYTLHYDYNGAAGAPADAKYIAGETVTLPANPTKNIMSPFQEWSYSTAVTVTDGTFPMPAGDLIVTAVFGGLQGQWFLVTDESELQANDKVIIAAKEYDYAMSTTQNNNNRGKTGITKKGNVIYSPADAVQIFELETGTVDGSWAFKTLNGTADKYIYAAGSNSNNYLRSEDTKTGNSSFVLDINGGKATAQGTSSNKVMRYNADNNAFACYGSATQKSIALYRFVEGTFNEVTIPAAEDVIGGTIKADQVFVKAGETVTLTYTPKRGYTVGTLTVTGASGSVAVSPTIEAGVTEYTFTMPAEGVTVAATFNALPPVVYNLMEDPSTLIMGQQFVFVGTTALGTDARVAGAINNYRLSADAINDGAINTTDKTLSLTDEAAVDYIIEGEPGAYKIMNEGMFLKEYGTNQITWDATDRVWNITIEDGKTVISTTVGSDTYKFQYNTSGDYFTAYKTDQQPIYIYTRSTETYNLQFQEEDNTVIKTIKVVEGYTYKYTIKSTDRPSVIPETYEFLMWTDGTNRYKTGDVVTVSAETILKPCWKVTPTEAVIDIDNLPESVTEIVVSDGKDLNVNDDKSYDNVTVEAGGKISGSSTLTVNNLTLKTSLGTINGDDNTGGKSGEILNPENINAQGEVWIEIELTQDAEASAGWYAFSVPFPVDALNGVYYGNTKLQNEVGYAIMSHFGDLRAQNEYAWKKFRGIMQPGEFYVITVGNTDYKTLRFKKVAGTKIFNEGNVVDGSDQMATEEYASSIAPQHAGWNGLGNPYLEATQVGCEYLQFYDHGANVFRQRTGSAVQLMVGSAFFYQSDGSAITFTKDKGHSIALAPARAPKAIEKTIFEVRLNDENGREADNLFLTAREEAKNEYEIGRDVAKLSMGTAKCAQMWVPAYGAQLGAADFPLVNNKAIYPLSINTPKEGTYFISAVENENATIYLTYNGKSIWNLSMSACEVELTKGLNEGYGLKLVVKAPQTPTGIESISDEGLEIRGAQKIVLDDHVYILRGGKMYDVTGKMVR